MASSVENILNTALNYTLGQSTIGIYGFVVQAHFVEKVSSKSQIVTHSLEDGSNVTDHKVLSPTSLIVSSIGSK